MRISRVVSPLNRLRLLIYRATYTLTTYSGGGYRHKKGHDMAVKVPRKMDTLIRFFKEVIANDKMSIRVRMQAAQRLDDLYSRHEMAASRKERSELRKKAGQEAVVPTDEANKIDEALESELSEEEQERLREERIFRDILEPNHVAKNSDC
jgi:hypothetical protein